MNLSNRQRQVFYEELSRLLRTDLTFPQALKALLLDPDVRNTQPFLRKALSGIESGLTPADALAKAGVGNMESALLLAAERAGSGEKIYPQLAAYFGLLERVRGTVIRQLAYPVFILHIAVVVLAVPALMSGQDRKAVILQSGGFLLACYLAVAVIIGGARLLIKSAGRNATADNLLQLLPLFGKAWRGFVLARFCSTWKILIDTTIHPSDALLLAAEAGGGGGLRRAAMEAREGIRAGRTPVECLRQSAALPPTLLHSLRTGEDSGTLDEALGKWAEYYEESAVNRMEVIGVWLPKLVTLLIYGYVGWRIISLYQGALVKMQDMFDL